MERRRPMLKVILLGDSGVGKTSLISQYVNKKFSSIYKATIGLDFYNKDVFLDGRKVTLQIWDTVGHERFQSLGVAFYRGVDCAVLVYDVSSPVSYHSLKAWKEEVLIHRAQRDSKSFPFVVLGNKIDLGNQICCDKDIQDMVMCDYTVPCFLTSAQDGTNVDKAFEEVARMAYSEDKEEYLFNTRPEVASYSNNENRRKKCHC